VGWTYRLDQAHANWPNLVDGWVGGCDRDDLVASPVGQGGGGGRSQVVVSEWHCRHGTGEGEGGFARGKVSEIVHVSPAVRDALAPP
jgi:hypothetical protein